MERAVKGRLAGQSDMWGALNCMGEVGEVEGASCM